MARAISVAIWGENDGQTKQIVIYFLCEILGLQRTIPEEVPAGM